ncbi:alpha/beta hydrolase [Marinobacter sp. BW6]|uniref:alpha/beta fold hydrolase n=1 Tax=Marinobacter sp. BW6 TaxID=2592624 RepID=UPI0011DE62E6|nr:alpha/beta hydrolase [Marinobacter sp. BW6]TYC62475.1 alpha/beta hydrolase [Marinobacter sp. BW6]
MNLSLNMFQAAFGVYSRLLPSSAASKAVELMTMPRIKAERRASSRELFERVVPLSNDGLLSIYGNGPKKILVLHGWSGWIGQFKDLISEFDPGEYTIFAVHPAGHGESQAAKSHPGRFIEAVLEAHEYVDGSFDVGVGHSLGAAALVYAQSIRGCFDRLVLVSGPATIEGVLSRFARFVNLGQRSERLFVRDMEETVGLSVDRLDLISLAPSIETPVLLIHDELDSEVPVAESSALHEAFPRSRLRQTTGYGHSRLLQKPDVVREIIEFTHSSFRP